MKPQVLNRRLHYWISIGIALPLLCIVVTGILLQVKKQWTWVQPPELRGSGTAPVIGFDSILESVRGVPELGVSGWKDVGRIDVRPSRGIAKVLSRSGWEAQVDLATGAVLQTAYRRSDLIESIHDGSYFAGDWTKLGLFLPSGFGLFLMLLSGLWLFWLPISVRRARKGAARRPGVQALR